MNHNSKHHGNSNSHKTDTTEIDLHLDLLADPTKLKPISKTLNVERIDENNSDSEDSDLIEKIRRSNKSEFLSSDSSDTSSRRSRRSRRQSSRSSSSDTSSITTRSSRSSRSRRSRRYDSSSESHRKTDDYIKDFNNIRSSGTDRDRRNDKRKYRKIRGRQQKMEGK